MNGPFIKNKRYLSNKVRESLLGHSQASNIERIRDSRIVWHTATPKSASSFFMRYIKHCTIKNQMKYNRLAVFPSHGNRYQSVCSYVISNQLLFSRKKSVFISSHQHTLCSDDFIKLISKKHTVICQTRSILDTIVSLIDYLDSGVNAGFFLPFSDKYWDTLTYNDKIDEVIDCYLPWHIHYLQSWILASDKINVKFFMFDDIVKSPNQCFNSIFEQDQNAETIEVTKSKFNKGISGRGKQNIPSDKIDQIKEKIMRLDKLDQSLIKYI